MMEVSGQSWRLDSTTHGIPLGPMRTFAIEPSHPLVPEWGPLRNEILAALDRSQVEWLALEVFRRRRTIQPVAGEEDTTILITGRRVGNTRWRDLDQIVREICALHGQGHLRIELVEGAIARYTLPSLPYETASRMGSSIGPAGVNWAAGTLGGYVTLSCTGHKDISCALTCHHVLRPVSEASEPVMSPDPTLRIEQPAAKDFEEDLERLSSVIASQQAHIEGLEAQIEAGWVTESRIQGLEVMRRRAAGLAAMQATKASFDRSFGSIFGTSGYRTASKGCALDWGIVQVDSRRLGPNEVCSTVLIFL